MSVPTPLTPPKKENWFQKQIKKAKRILARTRDTLERWRKKNPKVFDGLARFAEVVWVLGSTYCTNLASNLFAVAIVMCIGFAGLYLFQWALLTNKSIRELDKEKELHQQKLTEMANTQTAEKDKLQRERMAALVFVHSVAHNIKTNIAKIPNQKMSVTRNNLSEFLSSGLNSLEDILTDYYGVPIRASIKLCARPGVLKTYARGQNNISSRGGVSKVQKLNKKEILIEDNYAYNAIMQRQLQYFAEGDLCNLSDKENDSDVFFCEYGDNWKDMFLSSIIIPLRYPIMTGSVTDYKMLGLICIDSKDTFPEWSNAKKTYAYRLTAYFADVIYSFIDQYMRRQELVNQKERRKVTTP